ncbi:peptidyl-prolyl cis-trans isomerase [Zhongshania sp.]|uniref:peptidylprolyl isomerase n=1 Tax=Zhongshania sp. TaxID=1971902 RepID=UPI003564B74C
MVRPGSCTGGWESFRAWPTLIRLLRAKLFHFMVFGIVLYGVDGYYSRYQQRELVCPSKIEIDSMAAKWAQQNRQPMTDKLRQALRQSAMDEQMLFREALIKGLHKRDDVIVQRLLRDAEFLGVEGDRADQIETVLAIGLLDSDEVIRRRLIQLLEHRVIADTHGQAPNDQDLRRLYDENPAISEAPPRYSFQQRFYSGDTTAAKMRATQALSILNGEELPASADVFLSGELFNQLTAREINRIFGAGFWSDTSPTMSLGQWFGPVKSVYGWHLVKWQGYFPRVAKDFAAVRPELSLMWRREQQRGGWQAYVTELRGQYRVLCNDEV